MAICDGNYKFIYVDAGKNGRISDGGVFNKCSFAGALRSKAMNLPSTRALPGRATKIPFVFVADDAFAIRPNLLKPFAGRNLSPLQRVFNYRLSRGRRCIENAFGIMSAVFRVNISRYAYTNSSRSRKSTKNYVGLLCSTQFLAIKK